MLTKDGREAGRAVVPGGPPEGWSDDLAVAVIALFGAWVTRVRHIRDRATRGFLGIQIRAEGRAEDLRRLRRREDVV